MILDDQSTKVEAAKEQKQGEDVRGLRFVFAFWGHYQSALRKLDWSNLFDGIANGGIADVSEKLAPPSGKSPGPRRSARKMRVSTMSAAPDAEIVVEEPRSPDASDPARIPFGKVLSAPTEATKPGFGKVLSAPIEGTKRNTVSIKPAAKKISKVRAVAGSLKTAKSFQEGIIEEATDTQAES